MGNGRILDSMQNKFVSKFVTAASIKQQISSVHPALKVRNHDEVLQSRVNEEIKKRVALLNGARKMPPGLVKLEQEAIELDGPSRGNYQALAEQYYNMQANIVEYENRLEDSEFVPTARESMIPMTSALIGKKDSRTKALFDSPKDFLESYEKGLTMMRGTGPFGALGVLDLASGMGSRAAMELPKYHAYAKDYNVTSKTPRSLYPIPNTNNTFKGLLVNILRRFSGHLGVQMPIFELISSDVAPYFSNFVKESVEAAHWKEDVIFWNIRTLKRFDVANPEVPLEEDYPAGHGDNAILAYKYGILEAMKSSGIKYVASSNGDEFLWYYMFPALLYKLKSADAAMFAVAVMNLKGMMGGYFGNGQLIESSRIPYSYMRSGKVPEVLNTSFYAMNIDTLLAGGKELAPDHKNMNIVCKPTWTSLAGQNRFVNTVGFDSWMGDEFSRMIAAADGKMQIFESSYNLFLGMKGPQEVADNKPIPWLNGISYSAFYAMMAHKVFRVLDVLLGKDEEEKRKLSEQLFLNNFELINVKVTPIGK